MSNYIVSARKYRPQTFDEVIGQAHVAKTLSNALQNDQLAQAFLFCGPRGVGKTTCARILAKVLNCQKKQNAFTPSCNTDERCAFCKEESSFNIFELDAASNNSVDHIRSLIDQVRFQPQAGEYKVFIIDEVHMLSTAAFNAFLKTLEEPPSYAIFILATTEKHKIIPTILSRCQIFNFKRISVQDIILSLRDICEKEAITAEEEGLQVIAQKADGALRDALSIFDKVVSSSGKNLTYKDVIENLNILDDDYYFKITDSCLQEDAGQVILLFNEIIKNGFEPEIFVQGLAKHFRNLRLAKKSETLSLLDASEKQLDRYKAQAELTTEAYIINALNILNQADLSLPISNQKALHVELALTRVMYQNRVIDLSGDEAKKKTIVKPNLELSAKSNQSVKPKQEKEAKPSKPPGQEDVNTEQKEEAKAEEKQTPVAKQEGLKKANFSTPGFSTDVNSLISKIKIKEKKEGEDSLDFNLDNVLKIWKAYKKSLDASSLKTSMEFVEIELKENTIDVYVPNTVSKEYIMQENAIVDTIRKRTQQANLALNLVVDPSRFPEFQTLEAKKVLTDNEKIKLMADKNPKVKTLFEKFSFKVDK